MRRYTANTVWLSIIFAVVLTIVTVALTRPILVWTNTPANIIDLADIYVRTIFWGIPFTLLYNVTSALMRALGDSKRPLYFLLMASFSEHRPRPALHHRLQNGRVRRFVCHGVQPGRGRLWQPVVHCPALP